MIYVKYNKEHDKIPVKLWTDYDKLELGVKEQIDNLQRLPFAFHHIAIMPDCHKGYGMPIGGILATEGVVIPNAVGVDIGCGMIAVKTSLKIEQLDKDMLKKIMGKIREVIPTGFGHHKEKQDEYLMPKGKCNWIFDSPSIYPIVSKEWNSALTQLGTLGGGNHFIEIQKDIEGSVWIMIHSGSRNLGYKVADYYNKLAIELNQRWFSSVPKNWELAFLPIETQEAKNYIIEMQYCVDFALANRKLMLQRIIDIFAQIFPTSYVGKEKGTFWVEPYINIAHNYARYENHFGKNVIVHRKGATSARKDEIGIIPGGQGSKSYIVRGLGNIESFLSCSHGAGRKMGRKEAERTLNLEAEIKKLDDQGIIHGIRSAKNLDEAAGAYKDIDEVMKNQADLVEIVETLNPLAVIKGD